MKVLIAGGGIGGLAAALSCRAFGMDVSLYERAARFEEIGAGLQVSPNGAKVLHQLGLGAALERIAFRPRAIELRRGTSGAKLFTIPLGDEAVQRYGAPYYHVHRADLLQMLVDALVARASPDIHRGKEVVRFTQSNHGVALHFTDGTQAEGDVLIGADGIHSVIRTEMLGVERPRFTGNVAWRITVSAADLPTDLIPPVASIWVGARRHAVTYYVRRGELVNFVGVVERDDWRSESWIEQGAKTDLAADFAGWAKPITTLIAEAKNCFRWALFDRDPLPVWSRGRVTLLGDACHPMLPFLAQGAAMAIEDAWVLARTLAEEASAPENALRRYEALRKPRTTRAQRAARTFMTLYHLRDPVALPAHASLWLADKVAPRLIGARQDWIYGYDAAF